MPTILYWTETDLIQIAGQVKDLTLYNSRGIICISFASGIIAAVLLPHKAILIAAAAVLAAAGIGFCRY